MRKATTLVSIAFVLLAACGRETPRAPQELEVVASDYAFQGVPETIEGGVVNATLRNEGKVLHELAFLDIDGTSFATFKKEFPKVLEGGPFPKFMKAAAVALTVKPGKSGTTQFTLPQGEYMLMCAINEAPPKAGATPAPEGAEEEGPQGPPHYELGMRQNVTVEGGAENARAEAPDGEFVARDYSFETPENLSAGAGEYVFRNEGPKQWHFMSLSVFPEGTDENEAMEAYAKLIQTEEGSPPPAGVPMSENVLDTGIFSPGLGGTFKVTLERGRTYMAACFIQDLAGGPPHAIGHKMYKAFTVS